MRVEQLSVSLEFITPNALQLIERAGRTCYKSADKITDDSAETFVKMVLARGHESVVEHPYASFRVVSDRGVSHEFVRHRLMSYSQESTRYCNYGRGKFRNEIAVIEPPRLSEYDKAVWKSAMEDAERSYMALIKNNVAPQIARSVLPICLKTEFVATANFREWRHFLKLRTSPAAHPMMREVAHMISAILLDHARVCFEDVVSPSTAPTQ